MSPAAAANTPRPACPQCGRTNALNTDYNGAFTHQETSVTGERTTVTYPAHRVVWCRFKGCSYERREPVSTNA